MVLVVGGDGELVDDGGDARWQVDVEAFVAAGDDVVAYVGGQEAGAQDGAGGGGSGVRGQGLGLLAPPVGVPDLAAAAVQQVEAAGGGVTAGTGGELPPEPGRLPAPGHLQEGTADMLTAVPAGAARLEDLVQRRPSAPVWHPLSSSGRTVLETWPVPGS
ncbi:hypothetical protein ACIPYS_38435 [Kitasatospora sp. NPDC089913]|uniref:hypothetical protein n=1 Tax=Kitasatospora sp. NPDC089913 TaxID=3364080 RepID=UPI0037F58EF6